MAIAFGLKRFLHDIRYHRERFRQFIGISFVILVSVAGEPEELLFFAGGVLVFLGIAVRLWASGHIKKNKALATDGPYAYVRHPTYVGNLTLGVGFALASGLWWSLPLFIFILLLSPAHTEPAMTITNTNAVSIAQIFLLCFMLNLLSIVSEILSSCR